MIVLALDTTGPHCSVAVAREGDVLAEASERIGRGHAERLGPMVETVLAEAGIAASDVTRVAVCRGPGSFTGLRVGLAFAKGFALPRSLPVLGFDATKIAAAQVDPDGHLRLAVIIDVRRGELGWAGYDGGRCVSPFTVGEAQEVRRAVEAFGAGRILRDPVPDMRAAARLAATANPAHVPAEPLYARAPDAKLPGGIDPNAAGG